MTILQERLQIPESLVDWQWIVKSCSFVPLMCHPLPRQYRSKLFSSAQFLRHYCIFHKHIYILTLYIIT